MDRRPEVITILSACKRGEAIRQLSEVAAEHFGEPATVLPEMGIGARPLIMWHLLSMDAPTVALCWTMFTASATQTRLTVATDAAMWLAVWTVYAADRLLDTRHLAIAGGERLGQMERRHLFHYRYRQGFRVAIVASLLCLGVLLPMLPVESLRLYATEGVFMAGYLILVHSGLGSRGLATSPREGRGGRLPKELLVGPFFSAAVFIPTVSRRPELRWELLPLAILFAGLCSLNCLSIFAWEHAPPYIAPFGTGWAVRRLQVLACLFVAVALSLCVAPGRVCLWPVSFRLYALACAGSGLALWGFGRLGQGLSRTTLRVAADVCLLTPLLVFPFLRNG